MTTTKTKRSTTRTKKRAAGAASESAQPRRRRKDAPAPDAAPGPEDRRQMIAVAAYQRASERGFAAGHEMDDWLAAEREVDQRLGAG